MNKKILGDKHFDILTHISNSGFVVRKKCSMSSFFLLVILIVSFFVSRAYLQTQKASAMTNEIVLATSRTMNQKTVIDKLPPIISEVQLQTTVKGSGSDAYGEVEVSWKTNEPATSLVEYGQGSNVKIFSSRSTENTSLETQHIVVISGIPTSTIYTLRPISRDQNNNYAAGQQQPVIIGRASENLVSILLSIFKKIFGF